MSEFSITIPITISITFVGWVGGAEDFKISAPSSCRKEPKRPAKSISLNDLYDLHGEILLILIFQTLPKIGIRILFLLISVMYRLTCIN